MCRNFFSGDLFEFKLKMEWKTYCYGMKLMLRARINDVWLFKIITN